MADLFFKACLKNQGNYDSVLAMAKSSSLEEVDLSLVPKRMPGWEHRPRKDVAWKVDEFVLYIAPEAFPGVAPPPRDVCSVQAFDIDRLKMVDRLRANSRFTDMHTGKTGANLLVADFMTPQQAQVMVMDFKPRPQDVKNGHHRVLLVDHY